MKLRMKTLSAVLGAALLMPVGANALTSGGGSSVTPTTPSGCSSDCTRGPAPTTSSLEAARGPFSIGEINVPSSVDGFGGGTIHYPKGTSGKMALISVGPGFLYGEGSIKWVGERLASHGFVVITGSFTNTVTNFPDERGRQLGNMLDYAIDVSKDSGSPIYNMVDENRLGAAGWSMGGGGTMQLATNRTLTATMPLAPWYLGSSGQYSRIKAATLVVACENDIVAPVGSHADVMYDGVSNSTPKALLEVAGEDHFCVTTNSSSNHPVIGKYAVAWFKRFMDNDTRYNQFLCGVNHTGDSDISRYQENCSTY